MISKRKKYDWGCIWQTDDGKIHRLDGPAIERNDGTKWWYVDGKCHRLDGPAVECDDGSKWWYIDGKLHRLDGPAVEYSNGTKHWYVNGKNLTEEQFNKHLLVIKHRNRQKIRKWINDK